MKAKLSEAQILMAEHLRELGAIGIDFEYQPNPKRKWRADIWCLLSIRGTWESFLFEADGGTWSGGHRRGKALEADYERQNWCQLNGYKLIRFSNQQILTGEAKAWLAANLHSSSR